MRWRSMVMKFKTLLFILVVLLLGASGVNAQSAPDSALLTPLPKRTTRFLSSTLPA
jgi:hypothetical protein